MPLAEGTRYRFRTTKTGKKIRLAFQKGTNKVIEAIPFVKGKGGKLEKKVKGRK